MAGPRSSQSAAPSYPTLEPRIRHVSVTKIKKKWKRLPPASQSCVRELLMSVEQHTKHHQTGRKSARSDASEHCVKQLSERLIERLPRMPFPPSAVDESYDFELNLHRIRSIEEQLASNGYAMNLLNTQIKHETRLLGEDKEEVAALEESLRSNDAHRSKRLKSLHTIAQNMTSSNEESYTQSLSQSIKESAALDWSTVSDDKQMQPHLLELHNHLDSMKNNKDAMHGIMTAMGSTKQALLHVEIYQSTQK